MAEFICHEDEIGMMRLNIPTEQIVRCRDCDNARQTRNGVYYYCDLRKELRHVVDGSDFCSQGKPRG